MSARFLQPTFCLIHTSLADSVRQYVGGGGRKLRQWAAQHGQCLVQFDDAQAFYNANTPDELARLQDMTPPHK